LSIVLTTRAWRSFQGFERNVSAEKWRGVLFASFVERDGQMVKVRVLLADDHPNMLEMVENILAPIFEVVGKVADGKSLLEATTELNPDVIVTDISMPILNGIEAVKQLKESGCRAKVVFLTVHSDQELVRVCFEAGASGYVLKPRMATDLLFAMRAALAEHSFTSTNLTYRN
jgi:DNA-binding NarL/FixJ family response regulator